MNLFSRIIMNKYSSLPSQSFEKSVQVFNSKKRTRNILYDLPTDSRYLNTDDKLLKSRFVKNSDLAYHIGNFSVIEKSHNVSPKLRIATEKNFKLKKSKLRLSSIEKDLQNSAMKLIMEKDQINMKNMLTSSQNSIGSLSIRTRQLEGKKKSFMNPRKSVESITEKPYFENNNRVTQNKRKIIDLSNTLLNKPYSNQINKVVPIKSPNQIEYDLLVKEIAKFKK